MGSTRVVMLLLALACVRVAPADEPGPPPAARLEPALRLRLLAPLAGPRNGFFHSGLGRPLFEAAGAAPEGTLSAGLRFSQTHSADTRDVDGQRSRFDGLLIELARLRLDLAVHARLSLFADLRVAGWDERRDVFRVYGEGSAQPVTQGEAAKLTTGRATSRHENLATAGFGAAVTWWRSEDRATALGTSLLLKLPGFRRGDLTSSGTGDVALTALASLGLHERLALHLNAGVVVPLGRAGGLPGPPGPHAGGRGPAPRVAAHARAGRGGGVRRGQPGLDRVARASPPRRCGGRRGREYRLTSDPDRSVAS